MATPLAYSHYERLDLEIWGCLPFSEYLKYPLLGVLVLRRRALRAFEPAYHVLHWRVPLLSMCFILCLFLYCLIRVILSGISCHFRVRNISTEADYLWSN